MPELSRFFGIIITMYYADHDPPHFHARYGGFRAKFSIRDLQLLEGAMPKRVMSLVLEWAFEQRAALEQNWALMTQGKPLQKIPPLE